jgi:hypothetical protein
VSRAFVVTTFASAALLFLLELLAGRFLLPWFGGASAVWATSLVFFQVLLLAGYAWAHLGPRWLGDRLHAGLHAAGAIGTALLLLWLGRSWPSPLTPPADWRPDPASDPVLGVVRLLGATVGLPFLVLATSGPLLQRWYAALRPEAAVHRLYAVSNAGSLVGLLAWPFVVEPWLPLTTAGWAWAGLYAVCAASLGALAPSARASAPAEVAGRAKPAWIVLPALSSALLLATTNVLCAEVATVPLLWVLPLAVYLLSFVVAFEGRGRLDTVGPALVVAVAACHLLLAFPTIGFWWQGLVLLGAQALASYACHAELRELRPANEGLTLYYLCIAAGGALGGLFVALVAPVVFIQYWEHPLVLLAILGWVARAAWADPRSWLRGGWSGVPLGLMAGLFAVVAVFAAGGIELPGGPLPVLAVAVGLAALAWSRSGEPDALPWWATPYVAGSVALVCVGLLNVLREDALTDVASDRNFYGVVRVRDREIDGLRVRVMEHGRTTHGLQILDRPRVPTAYFAEGTGVGLAIAALPPGEPHRIGVLGLGVGTLAAWARPGDEITFYEINPAVIAMARADFTFLSDSAGDIRVVPGDGRLALEREDRVYDVLSLDAFSGDSLPVHLLTIEAFRLYLDHLALDGILAVHVSNRHVDLARPVAAAAEELELRAVTVRSGPGEDVRFGAEWILLSRAPLRFGEPLAPAESPPWTDDWNDLAWTLR